MLKQRRYLTFLAIGLFACSETKQKESPAQEIVAPQLGGELRGVSIGDDYEKVLKTDPGKSLYSMPDEIVYRLPVKDDSGTWYEVTYNFNDHGLYDICVEIFPQDSISKSMISEDLLKLYVRKYGEAQRSAGFDNWRFMTSNAHVITVSLTDSLFKHNKPMIQVRYNEFGK